MLGLLFVTVLRTLEKQYIVRAEREECCMNMTFDADRVWRQGHHDAALNAYRRADALCPLDLLARYRMAQAYVHMRQTDRALAEYRYILARELPEGLSQTGRAHFELGQLLFSQRRTAQARLEWQAAVAAARADPYPQVGDLKMRRQAEHLLARTSRTELQTEARTK